eukprot:677016-Amphidinium_carterae.1
MVYGGKSAFELSHAVQIWVVWDWSLREQGVVPTTAQEVDAQLHHVAARASEEKKEMLKHADQDMLCKNTQSCAGEP